VKATSVCPTYCTFCTRSYAVGANTALVTKRALRPGRQRWDAAIGYITSTPQVQDVVVSGGDSYYLTPDQLRTIGNRILTEAPHVKRIRFASKGLAVAPGRVLSPAQWNQVLGGGGGGGGGETGGSEAEGGDGWAEALIEVSQRARREGRQIAWHTHFNHPREISWITRVASQRLYEAGVIVRNQTVLLRGVNDDVETMGQLIRGLADINISPVRFSLSFSPSP
jgi:lysine 2,3-aminomutase